jgi:hypothetical protein
VGGLIWFQLYDAVVRDAIMNWQLFFASASMSDTSPISREVDSTVFSCLELYESKIKESSMPELAYLQSSQMFSFTFDVAKDDLIIAKGDFSGFFDTTLATSEVLCPQSTF